jgi:phospholipase/lecithinase/hemolysin
MPKSSKEPPRFSNLYVFGDGFSDTGNAFQLTGGRLAVTQKRRFADDLVWIDYLSDYLWLAINPSSDPCGICFAARHKGEGINFATGGATTGTTNLFSLHDGQLELPGLQQQIQAYTASLKKKKGADPEALYIIAAGALEYLPWADHCPQQENTTVAIEHLTAAVKTLTQAGARHVMVVNVMDLARTPLGMEKPIAPGIVAAHNQALAAFVKRPIEHVNLMLFDLHGVMNEIIADAQHFGFRNTTETCGGSRPNESIFWDHIHPTSKVHQLIARASLETLCASTTLRLVTSCPLG